VLREEARPRHDDLALKGASVLVVDDNATNRRIFEGTLGKWGLHTTAVDGGAAAVSAFKAALAGGRPFDLVILDGQMPGCDGFETAARLNALAGAVAPTIMMVTSADQLGDAARCRMLGIESYLVKPVRQAALRQAIARALSTAQVMPPRVPVGPPSLSRRTPRRVLLAEDNVVNQRVASGILQKAGHAVTIAATGHAALEWLSRSSFDVVLMDMQMPEMGGAEAMSIIRGEERSTGRHLPIIALTAHAMKGDREICLKAGADGYVSKPIAARELLDQVDQLTAHPAPMPDDKRRKLLASVDNDEALASDIVRLFAATAPPQIAVIRAAIEGADAPRIAVAAHGLRGAATNFGTDPLIDSLIELETLAAQGNVPACAAIIGRIETQTTALIDLLRVWKEPLSCAS
jgi:two-component system sensor histidine kinase/response regulator